MKSVRAEPSKVSATISGESMKKHIALAIMGLALSSGALRGQQVLQSPAPAVGDLAPDFTLPASTRYGLLKTPIKLSDFRGSTVVLAFFYQARTKG